MVLMKDEAVLAAAIVMNKNVEVAVGTGFSLMDKRKYYKNPELLLKKNYTSRLHGRNRRRKSTSSRVSRDCRR